MAKVLGLEEGPKAEIHNNLLNDSKKYEIGKRLTTMNMDPGSRNSPTFMTD